MRGLRGIDYQCLAAHRQAQHQNGNANVLEHSPKGKENDNPRRRTQGRLSTSWRQVQAVATEDGRNLGLKQYSCRLTGRAVLTSCPAFIQRRTSCEPNSCQLKVV